MCGCKPFMGSISTGRQVFTAQTKHLLDENEGAGTGVKGAERETQSTQLH